jgi:hypothetical protein
MESALETIFLLALGVIALGAALVVGHPSIHRHGR